MRTSFKIFQFLTLFHTGKNEIHLFSFVEAPRKFIKAELTIRKLRSQLTDQKLCNNKFTWCFHKAKQVHCIHHGNVQETYERDTFPEYRNLLLRMHENGTFQ